MIAASASEMVPHGLPLDHDPSTGLSDGLSKMGSAWNQQLSTQEQLLFDSLQEHDPTLTAATQRAASFPRPIAMNPNSQAKGFVNEFGNSTKPAKPKVRGRFSAARRREVQEVRKRGACIRCRMLKKPVCLLSTLACLIIDMFSALGTARVPPALVSKAHVCGNTLASALELRRSLNCTMLVCALSLIELPKLLTEIQTCTQRWLITMLVVYETRSSLNTTQDVLKSPILKRAWSSLPSVGSRAIRHRPRHLIPNFRDLVTRLNSRVLFKKSTC